MFKYNKKYIMSPETKYFPYLREKKIKQNHEIYYFSMFYYFNIFLLLNTVAKSFCVFLFFLLLRTKPYGGFL